LFGADFGIGFERTNQLLSFVTQTILSAREQYATPFTCALAYVPPELSTAETVLSSSRKTTLVVLLFVAFTAAVIVLPEASRPSWLARNEFPAFWGRGTLTGSTASQQEAQGQKS